MDEYQAGELYEAARNAFEAGDSDATIDAMGELNAWLMSQGDEPFGPDELYYDDPVMAEVMWEFVDTLSHEEREAFFGY